MENKETCKILQFKPKPTEPSVVTLTGPLIDSGLSTSISACTISPMVSVKVSDKVTVNTDLVGQYVDLRDILSQAATLYGATDSDMAKAFTDLLDKIKEDDNRE